ncbi:hypothetical protein VNI00_019479 [Paramarasmius palmivorus]|uniref:Zn(2)-C6 fungal-type domain-containing protein n=1 Tax=Paramarasmius palmivorus TaxID=297713 RepID=A0AAW0AKH6_9AGAR
MSPSADTSFPSSRRRTPRAQIACTNCRRRKVKCKSSSHLDPTSGMHICQRCHSNGLECVQLPVGKQSQTLPTTRHIALPPPPLISVGLSPPALPNDDLDQRRGISSSSTPSLYYHQPNTTGSSRLFPTLDSMFRDESRHLASQYVSVQTALPNQPCHSQYFSEFDQVEATFGHDPAFQSRHTPQHVCNVSEDAQSFAQAEELQYHQNGQVRFLWLHEFSA